MARPIVRIDVVRQAESELREAFARGEFDQALREYVAAYSRADRLQDIGFAPQSTVPGPAREFFCQRMARVWARLPLEQRLPSVVAHVLDGLTVPDEMGRAPVIQLHPAPQSAPRPSFLAHLAAAYLERFGSEVAAYREQLERDLVSMANPPRK
jgi:hypothetical protein